MDLRNCVYDKVFEIFYVLFRFPEISAREVRNEELKIIWSSFTGYFKWSRCRYLAPQSILALEGKTMKMSAIGEDRIEIGICLIFFTWYSFKNLQTNGSKELFIETFVLMLETNKNIYLFKSMTESRLNVLAVLSIATDT